MHILVIELNDVKLGHHSFQFGIISRLGCKRVGTRYNVRGADKLGNVANYVETEQIVTCECTFNCLTKLILLDCDKLFSFLQVRGSIPLKWTQKTNLKYKPNIAITKSWDPFKIHFNNQLMRYNRITIVNLINQVHFFFLFHSNHACHHNRPDQRTNWELSTKMLTKISRTLTLTSSALIFIIRPR